MVLMSVIVGYIFKDIFVVHKKKTVYEPLDQFKKKSLVSDSFWFSVAVTAPAILFHELGHKFVAMAFGLSAVFKAAYTWMFFGIILKMFTGVIFFVPAFVEINGSTSPLQFSIIAFSGPFVNLILWLLTAYVYKYVKVDKKYLPLLIITSKINMLLFVFNMLPIPGFDGFKVYSGILSAFF